MQNYTSRGNPGTVGLPRVSSAMTWRRGCLEAQVYRFCGEAKSARDRVIRVLSLTVAHDAARLPSPFSPARWNDCGHIQGFHACYIADIDV